jgi:HAE1 family hydrophobic/amphiphilic exporter-1
MDGTQEIGLAVLATTLSIVAVFMPIGFMGGIIGKFFHEFGITIVAAVLISMFVSFTLDPMLSSVWHDPSIHAHGQRTEPVTFYDKTIGRVTGWFDRATDALAEGYQRILRWSLVHKLATLGIALGIFVLSVFMVPLLGTEFVPKADFSETTVNFYTPWARRWRPPRPRRGRWKASCASCPRCATRCPPSTPAAPQGKMYASIYVRLVDRKDRSRSVDADVGRAARAPAAGARHHRHPRGPAGPGGRAKAD